MNYEEENPQMMQTDTNGYSILDTRSPARDCGYSILDTRSPARDWVGGQIQHPVSSIGRRSRPICVHLRYLRLVLDGMTHG